MPQDVITGNKKEITKLEELPLFKFEKLANATNNFHFGNMLGKGGFGPVYKVIFSIKDVYFYFFTVIVLYKLILMIFYYLRDNWKMDKKLL